MFREKEPQPYFQVWQKYTRLVISYSEVVFVYLLYNFKTVKDFVMKICTNIRHNQTMCRENEP